MIFVVFFVITYFAYGSHPKVDAPTGELVSSHDGDRTRALTATLVLGFAVLCVPWFSAELSSVLRDAGNGGGERWRLPPAQPWGAVFLLITLREALACSLLGVCPVLCWQVTLRLRRWCSSGAGAVAVSPTCARALAWSGGPPRVALGGCSWRPVLICPGPVSRTSGEAV